MKIPYFFFLIMASEEVCVSPLLSRELSRNVGAEAGGGEQDAGGPCSGRQAACSKENHLGLVTHADGD